MKILFLLLKVSLKRARALLLVTLLLLTFFQFLLVLIGSSLHHSGEFDQLASLLPPIIRAVIGPALAAVMSFSGVACIGFMDLGIEVSLLALIIALATAPAAEIESGFTDLILARPLARHWLITRTIVFVTLLTLLIPGIMVLGTEAALALLAPKEVEWPSLKMLGLLAIDLSLLLSCWAGVALAFASICRRAAVGATTGLIALVMLLLELTGRLWAPAQTIAWLSPFRYFVPFDLIMGQPLPLASVVVLLGIAASGWVIAYAVFAQRDI